MALRNEVEALRDRTLSALADTHDYYTYTTGAWRTLQLAVQRDGLSRFAELGDAIYGRRGYSPYLGPAMARTLRPLRSSNSSPSSRTSSSRISPLAPDPPQSLSSRQLNGKESSPCPTSQPL